MPATYRYEIAKTGRAQCQVRVCKDKGDKIQKGEFRFGSLVTIKEHDTWKWKHWGCVTPSQIETIIEQIGGLDGLDLENDLDILDGYDELPAEAQDKIKYALKNGHVNDEDWRGDLELNVRGAKGLHKRTPKKKKATEDADGDGPAEDGGSPVPKAKRGRPKKTVQDEDQDVDGGGPAEDGGPPAPKAKRGKGKTTVQDEDQDAEEERPKKKAGRKRKADAVEADVEENKVKSKPKRSTGQDKPLIKDEPESASEEPENKPKASSRRRSKKPNDSISAPQTLVDGPADEVKDKITKIPSRSRSKKVKEESEAEGAPEIPKARGKKSKNEKVDSTENVKTKAKDAPKFKTSRRSKQIKEESAEESEPDEVEVKAPTVANSAKRRTRAKK